VHRLRNAADVVGNGRDAGTERTEESAALVELGPVRKDGDGRVAERAVGLLLREVAEPPFDLEPVRLGPVRLERLERVARDEEARVPGPPYGLDRVAEPLVRPDHPEGEHRAAVVLPFRLAREDGVGDDPESFRLDVEAGERLPAVLAVNDDPVEARVEPAPEVGAVRGAAGQ